MFQGRPFSVAIAAMFAWLAIAAAYPASASAQAVAISPADLAAFEARPIGPAVTGGRIADLEAVADDPSTLWVASASGGLWKTTNRGHNWSACSRTSP